MRKIVIAIDSFKGCLSSAELAEAAASGVKDVFPETEICKLPIADGGEGTAEVLTTALNGKMLECAVCGPLRNPVRATYGWIEKQRLAVIEMAAASGLALIPYAEGNVLRTTSYGTGQLIADALHRGCRRVLLAVGGSATNDAGVGMLQALGYRFLNGAGEEVADGGAHLGEIAAVDTSSVLPEVKACRFEVATDVRNPFYGDNGAARIFAPQKGATPQQVELLDKGMACFAAWIHRHYSIDLQQLAGSGAAGGAGGGCAVFLHARLCSGIELVKDILHFDERLPGADLVITGEGKMDAQTTQGKVISGVLESARRTGVPVLALTGNCSESVPVLESDPLLSAFSIHPAPIALEDALNPHYTYQQVQRVVRNIMKLRNNITVKTK